MKAARAAVALVVVVAVLACTTMAQRRMDNMRAHEFDEQLLYLPNENLLNHFTAGMSSVIADILWLKCIQYTSKHFKGDLKFTWLGHMCDTITQLDPYFLDVYRYGGIFLAALKADDDASIRLMEKGAAYLPDRWELPYEIAMIYLTNRRDQPGAVEGAAAYLRAAVATGAAPQHVLEVAQGLQRKHNLYDLERQMWTEMKQNHPDKLMRDLAMRKLILLDIRIKRDRLQSEIDGHVRKNGALPKVGALQDALGGHYFVDGAGKIQNTSLLDEQVTRMLTQLKGAIGIYKKQTAALPPSLDALVQDGILHQLPKHPYENGVWSYAPATGDVTSAIPHFPAY